MPSNPIRLQIRNVGHVTSFKNTKMLLRKQGRLITDPKKQKQMDAITRSIELQLHSAYPTVAVGTPMEHSQRSWIASLLPLDDSTDWVNEIHVTVIRVPKGDEGADITIEQQP